MFSFPCAIGGDLTGPVGSLPPSVVAFVALGLAVGVGVLGAGRFAIPDGTPFTTRLAAAGGGAVLGVGPSLFARTGSLFVLGTSLAIPESAVLVTVACLAGAVVSRSLAADGRRSPGPLAALTLVASLVIGAAIAVPASSTLAPTLDVPWWVFGALSALVVPLSVLGLSRRQPADATLAPAGLAVLVVGALGGTLLGFVAATLASVLARPSLPVSFHLPPFGPFWVDALVGTAVLVLAAPAGLSPGARAGGRAHSVTDHTVDD